MMLWARDSIGVNVSIPFAAGSGAEGDELDVDHAACYDKFQSLSQRGGGGRVSVCAAGR